MAYLRLAYRIPWLLFLAFIGTPVVVLCQYRPFSSWRFGRRSLDGIMAAWWGHTICRIFGLRLSVRGAVPPGPQLLVANHISWIDIPVLQSVATVGFVAKDEIRKWPVIGFLAKAGKTVFLERGNRASADGVTGAMEDRLRAGGNVAIFPEGGILPGPGVKRFHGRLFAAAIHTGVPVQPVMLRYMVDGKHDDDMTFLPGENFVANFFRLFMQSPRDTEVEVLPLLESTHRRRRDLAAEAESAVREAYEAGPLRD